MHVFVVVINKYSTIQAKNYNNKVVILYVSLFHLQAFPVDGAHRKLGREIGWVS